MGEIRLAETLAALSLATDLADGVPLETGLRGCLLAVGVGREMGISGEALSDVYYTALLSLLGCTSVAHAETAPPMSEEVKIRGALAGVDPTRPAELMGAALARVGRGTGPLARAQAISSILVKVAREGAGFGKRLSEAYCEVGELLAARLGLGDGVVEGIQGMFERWDGSGMPKRLAGEQIPVVARIAIVGHLVQRHVLRAEQATVGEMLRHRSKGWFDPTIAQAFLRRADVLLATAEVDSAWDAVLEAEPEPRPWMPVSRLDQVARAFGEFADLKTPCMVGHSNWVADLTMAAARELAFRETDVEALGRAALLHDLGRVSVSNAIWAKPTRLSAAEWERVRLYPHYTERVLASSPSLAPLSQLAASHQERLDGSGYHRGLPATLLKLPQRVLAAAHAYQAMTEERPHRPALAAEHAARQLASEAEAGRLDREAVAAVIRAAGHRAIRTRAAWPAGLTDREVDVLRLVAKGHSNKEVAKTLFISSETVHNHVRHIYEKIRVSTRAGVAVFAMEKDLIQA